MSLSPLLGRLRVGWRRAAHALAELQARVLLTALYVLLVLPVGAVLRAVADPLTRPAPARTNWRPRRSPPPSLEEARRQ